MNNSNLIAELNKFSHFSDKEVHELEKISRGFDEDNAFESLNQIRTTVLKNSSDYSPSQIIYSMLYNMDAIENSNAESECFEKLF